MSEAKTVKKPSFAYALGTIIAVFAVIMVPALAWGSKIQPLFLLSYLVALPLCLRLGVPYKELQAGMVQSCSRAIVPIMILLINGGLVGTWIAAGTVPLIIDLGVKFLSPKFFLVAAFLMCHVFSDHRYLLGNLWHRRSGSGRYRSWHGD